MTLKQALERARDDMHLSWLALRDSGWTSGQIGKRYGVAASHVRTVLNRIDADDREAANV